ncbi:Mitochondrial matrix cochaperone [Apiotrichum porosum]|uniref:GrpE protein homolog, mitochondrial n=1 Tax=Apiotrichum porosum TaxID=105984 RepID=A0A427XKH3_9TREE|nr:Mitochondrial matrix cochaperone [Apiotrichum porosum]RSH79264.1 Mitochondrial matrix cochaperone [Apiotrichum porosum]
MFPRSIARSLWSPSTRRVAPVAVVARGGFPVITRLVGVRCNSTDTKDEKKGEGKDAETNKDARKELPKEPPKDPKAAEKEKNLKRIAELEAKIADLTKEMQYMRADYQTAVRRIQEGKAKAGDTAIAGFARDLLSTVDVFSKALADVPQPIDPATPLANFYAGIELTNKALVQTLEHYEVHPMRDVLGSTFNPKRHEATAQVAPADAPKRADGGEPVPGEIVEVSSDGWMIRKTVLRPAQVVVVQMDG